MGKRRRVSRKKQASRWPNLNNERATQYVTVTSTTSRDPNKSMENQSNRFYEHPYETRSKTLRTDQSSMNVDGNDISSLKRRKSDSSIVFLGKYRKIPELVVIDETEGRYTEFVEIPKNLLCLKEERTNCYLLE